MNKEFSLDGLPAAGQVANTDYSADRQRVEEGLFTRLNPQVDKQRQDLETSLVNRGIRPGSSAYQQEMGTFNQALNDQRTSILLQGGQEQSRLQNMQLANFGAQNTQRQNALQEQLTARNIPLNELLAVAGQGQIQQPNFVNNSQTQVGGTDVAGLIGQGYTNQLNAYNAKQQQLGGLFSAGASTLPLLMASDARVKRLIKRIGTLASGFGWYSFKYIWDDVEREGVMAQEVMQCRPDLIHTHPDGYMMVDYRGVL